MGCGTTHWGGCWAPSSRRLGVSWALLPRATPGLARSLLPPVENLRPPSSRERGHSLWLLARAPVLQEPGGGRFGRPLRVRGSSLRPPRPGTEWRCCSKSLAAGPPCPRLLLIFQGKELKAKGKDWEQALCFQKKVVKLYLLLFNATPAPSPAAELLSGSHSWGMPL